MDSDLETRIQTGVVSPVPLRRNWSEVCSHVHTNNARLLVRWSRPRQDLDIDAAVMLSHADWLSLCEHSDTPPEDEDYVFEPDPRLARAYFRIRIAERTAIGVHVLVQSHVHRGWSIVFSPPEWVDAATAA